MAWDFRTADHIRFGAGVASELASHASGLGSKVLLVTGATPTRTAALHAGLDPVASCQIAGEPTLDELMKILDGLPEIDVVVGIGGGSVIDAAKAIAALAANPGAPMRYLEVVGDGQPLDMPPYPMIAVPTTAGTGAEVTKNAVIGVPEHGRKVSLRDARMLPNLALIDPDLTQGAPIGVTAASGLDALTQCIEPYLSCQANPMTDALCREGITRASAALPKLLKGGERPNLREDMALASVMGGLALANSGLGAVHGFAGVIGGRYDAPHGAVCGRLLPGVLRCNWNAVQEHGETGRETRFRDVARWITGVPDLDRLTDQLETWLDWGGLPRLSRYGVSPGDVGTIAAEAKKSSSMAGNPVPLNDNELVGILHNAL